MPLIPVPLGIIPDIISLNNVIRTCDQNLAEMYSFNNKLLMQTMRR